MDIKSFNLKKEINDYLDYKKFSKFQLVQEKTIPNLIKGKDLFVEAPTGTGKTLSFLIPILETIDYKNVETQAIVIAPTRELSIQIHNVLNEMKEFQETKIKSLLAIGGKDFVDQLRKIKNGSQIIVGTADRIMSLRRKTNHNLDKLKYLVVDEVDMILNFGSFDEIISLSKSLPLKTTLSFFSASFPLSTQNYIKKLFNKQVQNIVIKVGEDITLTSNFIKAFDDDKENTLLKLINSDTFNPYFCIIFAKTNIEVEKVYKFLKENGIKKISIFHNGLSPRERNRLLKLINSSELVFLVTTDLMSRGMDFPGVTHIVNFSLPVDLTYYRHRIGRTNRNDVKGNIYDIYTDVDMRRYDEISKKNPNIIFERKKVK